MSKREREALAHAFVTLRALATHSLSPAQTRMATRAAGNCLWALGIDQYEGFDAVRPEGPTVDVAVIRSLTGEET